MLLHCYMALLLLLCNLRDGAEARGRRGGGKVARRCAPRLPHVARAIRAVRACASCHQQVGVFWCNWIVVNALHTTPGVRRVARRLRHDRKNARVPGRLLVPVVTLRVVCEPVRVLIEVGLWLLNCLQLQVSFDGFLDLKARARRIGASVIRTPVRTLSVCTAVGGAVSDVTGLSPCLEPDSVMTPDR
jgi:hypothetical protein